MSLNESVVVPMGLPDSQAAKLLQFQENGTIMNERDCGSPTVSYICSITRNSMNYILRESQQIFENNCEEGISEVCSQ